MKRANVGRVVYEFTDSKNQTYQLIDWGKYVEVSKVLENVTRDGISTANQLCRMVPKSAKAQCLKGAKEVILAVKNR